MTELKWDQVGERFFETGVDHGVLYIPNNTGVYNNGVAWNGLVSVSESPSGAEANAQYADNIKYLNLYSAEEFAATLEAFTYPDEFQEFDGMSVPVAGLTIGQQHRGMFGLSYRTRIGNDLEGDAHAYKLHLVYGCQASPSERAFTTVNDSPEPITFSWEIATTPVAVAGHPTLRPTAIVTIDSRNFAPDLLDALNGALYGTPGTDPRLPLPGEVITMMTTGTTEVTPTAPSRVVNTITIPTITGVAYFVNEVEQAAGSTIVLTSTAPNDEVLIEARPTAGYRFPDVIDTDWLYSY